MITVETRPVRCLALQWNAPGDGDEFSVISYKLGTKTRYGIHTMQGLKPVSPGDWLVLFDNGTVEVMAPREFNHKFKIIEEGQT